MAASLILYGSRARGNSRDGSDVDLILANEGETIGSPREVNGVSLHLYSKGWLEAEAKSGSLFAYHVAFEGVALEDTDDFIGKLRTAFVRKASYFSDLRLATLILRMILDRDWRDNMEAKRRYFWALRTILISASAENGSPVFSAAKLENFAKLDGLASLIDRRADASFADCLAMGQLVLSKFQIPANEEVLDNGLRDYLIEIGGIARDSVRILEEPEAIAQSGLAIYI